MIYSFDNAGAERFAVGYPARTTKLHASAVAALEALPEGSTVILERDPYTSNAKGQRDAKNQAFAECVRARHVTVYVMGCRVTDRYRPEGNKKLDRNARGKQWKDERKGMTKVERKAHSVMMKQVCEQDHHTDAIALLDAFAAGVHAPQRWPTVKRVDRQVFLDMPRYIREWRWDKAKVKAIKQVIKDTLSPKELLCFTVKSAWAVALICGLYYAACRARNRREFNTIIAGHAQGKNCYLRALLIRRMFRVSNEEATRRTTIRACRRVRLPLRQLGVDFGDSLPTGTTVIPTLVAA